MKALERRQVLIELLCERRHDKIENLAFELNVNERTIRRDLEELSLRDYYVLRDSISEYYGFDRKSLFFWDGPYAR